MNKTRLLPRTSLLGPFLALACALIAMNASAQIQKPFLPPVVVKNQTDSKASWDKVLRKGKRDVILSSTLLSMVYQQFFHMQAALAGEIQHENGVWTVDPQPKSEWITPSSKDTTDVLKAPDLVNQPVASRVFVHGNSFTHFGQSVKVIGTVKPIFGKPSNHVYAYDLLDDGQLQQTVEGEVSFPSKNKRYTKILNLSGTLMALRDDGALMMYDPDSGNGFDYFNHKVADISYHSGWFLILYHDATIAGIKVSPLERFSVEKDYSYDSEGNVSSIDNGLISNQNGTVFAGAFRLRDKIVKFDTEISPNLGPRQTAIQTILTTDHGHSYPFERISPFQAKFDSLQFSGKDYILSNAPKNKIRYLKVRYEPSKKPEQSIEIVVGFKRSLQHPWGATPKFHVHPDALSAETLHSLKHVNVALTEEQVQEIWHHAGLASIGSKWEIVKHYQ